jgi:hypothetical protein
MAGLTWEKSKAACRSDVRQTYRLFLRWQKDNLDVPKDWQELQRREFGEAPQNCPSCYKGRSMNELDWDTEEMSDGQFAVTISPDSTGRPSAKRAVWLRTGERRRTENLQIGATKLGSSFLTLPTALLTLHAVISPLGSA